MGLRDLAELVRAPAALSVPGDIVAGAAAAGVLGPRTLGLACSSVCLYWAGMAANDYADRELDAVERPERPIPSGRISPRAAAALAAGLTAAGLAAAGLAGVLAVVRRVSAVGAGTPPSIAATLAILARRRVVLGLLVTLLTFTAFTAVFTYVAPMLSDVTGLSPRWVSIALLIYGVGTLLGNALAGRVPATAIGRILPVPVALLVVLLLLQGVALHSAGPAIVNLFALGAVGLAFAPLIQTYLMSQAGPGAGGLAASVNISAAGVAGALGALLGGGVIGSGLGLDSIGAVAAVPALIALAVAAAIRTGAAKQPSVRSSSWPSSRGSS